MLSITIGENEGTGDHVRSAGGEAMSRLYNTVENRTQIGSTLAFNDGGAYNDPIGRRFPFNAKGRHAGDRIARTRQLGFSFLVVASSTAGDRPSAKHAKKARRTRSGGLKSASGRRRRVGGLAAASNLVAVW